MPFFSSSTTFVVKSKLPKGATKEQGVKMLQDKEFFIKCDPYLEKYELLEKEMADPKLPDHVKPVGPTSVYKIHDIVENVPKGVWGSNVESKYELTDVESGFFSRLHSPLSVTVDTVWEIRDAEDGDGLELVEEAEISASKMLVGVVKSQNESGAAKIQAKMIDRLKEELGES